MLLKPEEQEHKAATAARPRNALGAPKRLRALRQKGKRKNARPRQINVPNNKAASHAVARRKSAAHAAAAIAVCIACHGAADAVSELAAPTDGIKVEARLKILKVPTSRAGSGTRGDDRCKLRPLAAKGQALPNNAANLCGNGATRELGLSRESNEVGAKLLIQAGQRSSYLNQESVWQGALCRTGTATRGFRAHPRNPYLIVVARPAIPYCFCCLEGGLGGCLVMSTSSIRMVDSLCWIVPSELNMDVAVLRAKRALA